jgi:hypothetical protein
MGGTKKLQLGLGTNPAKRLALYRQLERLVEKHGDRAYQVIAESIAQAVDMDVPDRYFCKTVVAKFKDLRLWNEPVPW